MVTNLIGVSGNVIQGDSITVDIANISGAVVVNLSGNVSRFSSVTTTNLVATNVSASTSYLGDTHLVSGLLIDTNAIPTVAADVVKLGGYDLESGSRALAISMEALVSGDILVASTHTARAVINGSTFKVLLVLA